MNFKTLLTTLFSTAFILSSMAQGDGKKLSTNDIRMRDPFIYADEATKTYYMYAQTANREGSDFTGVEVYTSTDLANWNPPVPVLTLPDTLGIIAVWAPEVHEYKGRYYLFVTLTFEAKLNEKKPVESASWPPVHIRGTHVFYADSLLGPFKPFSDKSITPPEWMALDGTLYVENDTPYMVFCHEWVQTVDGTMDYIRLKDDLSGTVGAPRLMFRASDAPGAVKGAKKGKVTDGCFMYRSGNSGKLFMIWSTFIPGNGYCVLLTHSESGSIAGPWKEQKIIYKENGGHGMLFRTFDGQLLLALHQPNTDKKERLHLFRVTDTGQTLIVGKELFR